MTPAPAGAPAWQSPVGQYVHSHPLIAGDKLIFTYGWRGQYVGGALVLDRSSLQELWRCEVNSCVEGGAALYENSAVFGDAQGRIYAMRLDGAARPVQLNMIDGAIRSAPLICERRMYVTTQEGMIACLDARSGTIVRQKRVEGEKAPARIASTPVLYGRGVLFGALDGGLYQFDADGGRLDQVYRAESGIYTTPVIHDGKAIITTENGAVIMVDPRNGASSKLHKASNRIRATPLLVDDMLYVGSQDRCLYAIDLRAGALKWQFKCDHGITTTPLLINGLVIVGDTHGHVIAIEPPAHGSDVGKRIWQTPTPPDQPERDSVGVFGRFMAEGEHIVYGSFDGNVYALPWHLGHYDIAIKQAEQRRQFEAAAAYTLLSNTSDADRKAANLLSAARIHSKAARIYEWRRDLTQAAMEYEKAAAAEGGMPFEWQKAANLWTEVKQHEKGRVCLYNAARALKKPWLDVKVTSAAAFRLGEKGWLNLTISNSLTAKACNLTLRLDGGQDWSVCEAILNPELTSVFPWDVTCKEIKPLSAGELPLQLVIRYEDEWGNAQEQSRTHILPVASPDQPPVVYNNAQIFNGETHVKDIQGDAVLIERGNNAGLNQVIKVGGDAVITGSHPQLPTIGAA